MYCDCRVMYIAVLCIVTVVCCCASVRCIVYFGVCVLCLWCAGVRRYVLLNIGEFVCCDSCVLLCVCMGFCNLGVLCVVTVVCCCASVWDTVYWGFVYCDCILLLCYCCFSVNDKDKGQHRTDQEGPDGSSL